MVDWIFIVVGFVWGMFVGYMLGARIDSLVKGVKRLERLLHSERKDG